MVSLIQISNLVKQIISNKPKTNCWSKIWCKFWFPGLQLNVLQYTPFLFVLDSLQCHWTFALCESYILRILGWSLCCCFNCWQLKAVFAPLWRCFFFQLFFHLFIYFLLVFPVSIPYPASLMCLLPQQYSSYVCVFSCCAAYILFTSSL